MVLTSYAGVDRVDFIIIIIIIIIIRKDKFILPYA